MKKFIIYGAAAIGNLAKISLEKCEMEILGYIDQRAYELKIYNHLPVWSLDDVPEQYVTEETIVFVGVKNVYEHEKIARLVLRRGFRYIVYKPYNVLMNHGTKDEKYISDVYDMLFQASKKALNVEIPICRAGTYEHFFDYALLKECGAEVIAYIPLEFIYTNNYLKGGMEKWGNINILSFFTHIDFFRFLDNREDAFPQAYLEEYCVYTARLQNKIIITDAWKENVIENRTQIYEKMNENMNLDLDFFVRNAPEAVWNEKKCIFNLTSGKHRCAFFAAKGLKFIPLKISKSDYAIFFNEKEVMQVKELLHSSNYNIMIPHPIFYRDDRNMDKGEYAVLQWFARYYGKKTFYKFGKIFFENISIMDWSYDMGYFARFLVRLGCKVDRFVKPTELEKGLNRLFYSSLSYISNMNGLRSDYDICIIDGNKIQNIVPYIDRCKYIIIKYCTENGIKGICNSLNLQVILKITQKYENQELKGIYLLQQEE